MTAQNHSLEQPSPFKIVPSMATDGTERPMQHYAPKPEQKVSLTRADLIKRIVPWLNDLANHPEDISRPNTAADIIDLFFKSLIALGARDTWGYRQVLILSFEGLKEAGFPVPPYYPTCSQCGHSGADVLTYLAHVGGRGDDVLATHCVDMDACDARLTLKVMKGKD